MFKFSAVSQIWKKYIQKLNDWDLPLTQHPPPPKKKEKNIAKFMPEHTFWQLF